MPLLKTAAIVLHSRKWGEADRIITCYTRRFGKIRAIARGARRLKSRLGGSLEPFVLCELDLFEKPGDSLYRVSQVAMQEPFSRFRGDLTLMTAAARMVNLVAAIAAEGDADSRMFEALEQGLRHLLASSDPRLTVLLFQIRMLGLTGFKPQTEYCASCGRRRPETIPQFSPIAGGLICMVCASHHPVGCVALSQGSVAFLQQALRLTPGLLSRLKAGDQVRSEVETALEKYITAVAGRRLPAVDFIAT
ncbi:MAG TPA: DNA repair protein RecO [Nitrospiraceae bacterium]|nr:DNA repair protein RecO [Nitrospiraceae bacterium]